MLESDGRDLPQRSRIVTQLAAPNTSLWWLMAQSSHPIHRTREAHEMRCQAAVFSAPLARPFGTSTNEARRNRNAAPPSSGKHRSPLTPSGSGVSEEVLSCHSWNNGSRVHQPGCSAAGRPQSQVDEAQRGLERYSDQPDPAQLGGCLHDGLGLLRG